MTAKRGRTLNSFGGFMTPLNISGPLESPGQPVMVRMQGVPTMPGYRDRPGKWNVIIPPVLALLEAARHLVDKLRV